MHHLTGKDRSQTFSTSLEASIQADNPVRVIDAFVDALPLLEMGFKGVEPKATGRPSFDPAHLLKLYLYGYSNRIRSSRKLETECRRDLEVQWLSAGLMPAYHTIADFRKEHPEQLEQRKLKYEQLEEQVDQSDDGQVSTSDRESRALIQHHNVVEVSYNSQTSVDSKHSLFVDFEGTNCNDAKALAAMAITAKQILGKKRITTLADKARRGTGIITVSK